MRKKSLSSIPHSKLNARNFLLTGAGAFGKRGRWELSARATEPLRLKGKEGPRVDQGRHGKHATIPGGTDTHEEKNNRKSKELRGIKRDRTLWG